MAIQDNYEDYKREIELFIVQNAGIEVELYSIVTSILRLYCPNISLRDVSSKRRYKTSKTNRFYGNKGFPDFMVLERRKSTDAKILGCVEIKNPYESYEKHKKQLKGHVESFKKVLYTNGLEWRFFEGDSEKWSVSLGEMGKKRDISWKTAGEWDEMVRKIEKIKW